MSLIATEFLKLRTQLAMRMLLLGALGLTLLGLTLAIVSTQMGSFPLPIGSEMSQRGLLNLGSGTTLIAVFAAVGITSEYRHRTITSTFLATPARYKVLLSKAVLYAMVAVVYGILIALITTAAVLVLLSIEGYPVMVSTERIVLDYVRELGGLVLHALFGFGVGALLTNQIAAIVVVLVEPLVSGIVMAVLPKWGRFFPSQAAAAFNAEQRDFFSQDFLGGATGGLVFLGWCGLIVGAAIVLTQRRDVS